MKVYPYVPTVNEIHCDFCGIPSDIDKTVKEYYLTSGVGMGTIAVHEIRTCTDCKITLIAGLML